MHILGKIVIVLLILFVVLPALGYTAFETLLPQLGSAITGTVTSYFSSPSSNSTFSANGVNFKYPANWVSFNPGLISKFINTQNYTNGLTNGTNYTLSMVVPSSLLGGELFEAPSLIYNLLTKNTNITGVINRLLSNIDLVLAGKINYKNSTSFMPSNLVNSTLFSSLSHASGMSKINQTNLTINGVDWDLITISNFTFDNKVNLSGGSFALSYDNGTFCFVMGASAAKSGIGNVETAFDRILNSIRCS